MDRRIVLGGIGLVVAAVLVPVVVLGAGFAMAFTGNRPVDPDEELADGRVRVLQDEFVNLFAIQTGDGVVLVDAGMSPEGLTGALQRASLSPGDVRAVFLTHGHGDHVGGLAAVPDAAVYAAEAEIPLLSGEVASKSPVGRLVGRQDAGVTLTRAVRDGETVTVGDLTLRAFVIPGHTAGSTAWLADGVLFLGDSARAGDDGALRAAPWVFSDDLDDNRASLTRLASMASDDVQVLAFGHTGTLPGEALAAWTP